MDKREEITLNNLGPVVSLLTWIFEAAVIIAVGVKFTLSFIVPSKGHREDFALSFATVFSIGFSVSISLAVSNGIGKHQDALSLHQLESLQRSLYSAHILFVLVLGCVQGSILMFLRDVTPDRLQHRLIYAFAGFITVFSISAFLLAVFPCHPPRVWGFMESQCLDQLSFWQAFAGVSIVVESALVLLPFLIVYPLAMRKRRKAKVMACFAARLLVVAASAVQIYEAQRLKSRHLDWNFHAWRYLLVVVFVHGLSITTVCIPYIRNLLLHMESGMIQTGHVKLSGRHTANTDFQLQPIPAAKIATISSGDPTFISTGAGTNAGGDSYT